MPGSHIPTCPAVLQLVYYRRGWRHEVYIAWNVQGNSVVGLDTGRQWSGWHGFWKEGRYGGLVLWMHYTGDSCRARPHFFDRVMPRVYELYQGQQIRVFARMVTRLDLLPQLDMVPAAHFEGNPGEYVWTHL